MATPTYTLLDSVTLASSAASVTFSSIDQSYGDLVLVCDFITDSATLADARFTLNGDTGSNYNYVWMTGDGSSTYSSSNSSLPFGRFSRLVTFNNSYRMQVVAQIMDYSATDKHKSWLNRADASAKGVEAISGRWSNTSAVISLNFYPSAGNIAAGSTFYLYGIEA